MPVDVQVNNLEDYGQASCSRQGNLDSSKFVPFIWYYVVLCTDIIIIDRS